VRRSQIGLAVFAGLYVIVLVLWLSYQGRSIQRGRTAGWRGRQPSRSGSERGGDGLRGLQGQDDRSHHGPRRGPRSAEENARWRV